MLDEQQVSHPVDSIQPVTDASEIQQLQRAVREIYIDPLIKQYIVGLAGATRQHESVYLGASPRGSIALFRTSQAHALLEARGLRSARRCEGARVRHPWAPRDREPGSAREGRHRRRCRGRLPRTGARPRRSGAGLRFSRCGARCGISSPASGARLRSSPSSSWGDLHRRRYRVLAALPHRLHPRAGHPHRNRDLLAEHARLARHR